MYLYSNNLPEAKEVLESPQLFSPNVLHSLNKQANETAASIAKKSDNRHRFMGDLGIRVIMHNFKITIINMIR